MQQNIAEIDENPVKLDAKDRRILGELFENGRMPFSVVAKRVRLSKEVVNYRVKRLMEIGLLVGFNTVLDMKKIGWEMFFVFIRFRNIDVDEEKEILAYLVSHPDVSQLFRTMGNYDAVVKFFVRQHTDVDGLMKDVEARFEGKIDSYDIDCIVEEAAVPFSFMYDVGKPKLQYQTKGGSGSEALASADLRILKVLSKNARVSLSELATKVGSTRDIVKYHVKKLEKSGVILKYRPDTLPKVLGYSWYFLVLKADKLSEQLNKNLEAFLVNHPNVTYFYRTVRNSDVQVELRVKTNIQLNSIVMEIRGILKDVLKRAELLTILDEQKFTYVPDCVLQR